MSYTILYFGGNSGRPSSANVRAFLDRYNRAYDRVVTMSREESRDYFRYGDQLTVNVPSLVKAAIRARKDTFDSYNETAALGMAYYETLQEDERRRKKK